MARRGDGQEVLLLLQALGIACVCVVPECRGVGSPSELSVPFTHTHLRGASGGAKPPGTAQRRSAPRRRARSGPRTAVQAQTPACCQRPGCGGCASSSTLVVSGAVGGPLVRGGMVANGGMEVEAWAAAGQGATRWTHTPTAPSPPCLDHLVVIGPLHFYSTESHTAGTRRREGAAVPARGGARPRGSVQPSTMCHWGVTGPHRSLHTPLCTHIPASTCARAPAPPCQGSTDTTPGRGRGSRAT